MDFINDFGSINDLCYMVFMLYLIILAYYILWVVSLRKANKRILHNILKIECIIAQNR